MPVAHPMELLVRNAPDEDWGGDWIKTVFICTECLFEASCFYFRGDVISITGIQAEECPVCSWKRRHPCL